MAWLTEFNSGQYHSIAIGVVHSSSSSLRALDGDISKSHVACNLAATVYGRKNLQMPRQERETLLSLLTFVECTEAIVL